MAYGREQLRKAGKALQSFDTAYADMIEKGVLDNMKNMPGPRGVLEGFRGMTSAVPLDKIFVDQGAENAKERALSIAMNTGVFAANVGSRYLLPAGGVTLAGKGLYDLTAQFGGVADQQEPGQLSL